MLNEYQLPVGEYVDALWLEYDEDTETYSKAGVQIKGKQLFKSGRGVAQGQDSSLSTPIQGLYVSKNKFSFITTADLPFKPMDKITLLNFDFDGTDIDYEIRNVDIQSGSANNLANSQFRHTTRYNPKILELR